MSFVSVIVPAYNEVDKIAQTVQAVQELPHVGQVVVIDDGSIDGTAEAVSGAGVTVIRNECNAGKGAALNRGAEVVQGDIVALVDADLGNSVSQLDILIETVWSGEADLVIAKFPAARRKGGFGLVKGLARQGLRFYTGLTFEAPLSGQRVMTRDVLKVVMPFATGFGVEVAMTIKAARAGFRIKEVETMMSHRETGRNLKGFCHRGKQFIHVLRVFLRGGSGD